MPTSTSLSARASSASNKLTQIDAEHVYASDEQGYAGPNKWRSEESKEGAKYIQRQETRDVDPDSIAAPNSITLCDILAFFDAIKQIVGREGETKDYRRCKTCAGQEMIINEPTMLRGHIESYHREMYIKWCLDNAFDSQLPNDAKKREMLWNKIDMMLDSEQSTGKHTQKTPHEHQEGSLKKDGAIPYFGGKFRHALVEWIVATDQLVVWQPLSAVENPQFQRMLEMASRLGAASDGRIPGLTSEAN
ncbi:hypothetical protein BC835DRAFT_860700 [Cytidiella melzeri]|nr:hypothetical protein BC835DRAFT_860700 [Cytidiella melzeri]